jgi:glutamate racemase
MDNRPIVFLDSGIGGITYCRHFLSRNPGEPLVYLADHRYFPYGGRSGRELREILKGLMEALVSRVDPKMVVLACNTATVSALSFLRDRFPQILLVGTVPAVKPAVLGSRTGRIGVLGTRRTIEDPYIAKLAGQYGPACSLVPIAAPELVDFVEYRYRLAGEGEIRRALDPYLERFREAGADAVVLGCTHFLFLLKEFREAAAPDMVIYDSVEGITRRLESLLDEGEGRRRAGGGGPPARRFYVRDREDLPQDHAAAPGGETPEDRDRRNPWPSWAEDLGFRLDTL